MSKTVSCFTVKEKTDVHSLLRFREEKNASAASIDSEDSQRLSKSSNSSRCAFSMDSIRGLRKSYRAYLEQARYQTNKTYIRGFNVPHMISLIR